MASLRFPEDLDGGTDPWIVFSTQRPQYSRGGRSTREVQVNDGPPFPGGPIASGAGAGGGNSVALYFPTGHTINDSLGYESQEEGLAGLAISRLLSQGGGAEDVVNADIGEVAAGAAARTAAAAAPGGAVYTRSRGRVANPREFMLFKAPSIREFSFSFTFIPQTKGEADNLPNIIRFFREAAYPVETATEYIFPDTFRISYKNGGGGIIKIPEVACTSINVTYNPNSISFFRDNGMPVQTTLELSFTELKPISRQQVEQGF